MTCGRQLPGDLSALGGAPGQRESRHVNIIEVGDDGAGVTVTHMSAGRTPPPPHADEPIVVEPEDDVSAGRGGIRGSGSVVEIVAQRNFTYRLT